MKMVFYESKKVFLVIAFLVSIFFVGPVGAMEEIKKPQIVKVKIPLKYISGASLQKVERHWDGEFGRGVQWALEQEWEKGYVKAPGGAPESITVPLSATQSIGYFSALDVYSGAIEQLNEKKYVVPNGLYSSFSELAGLNLSSPYKKRETVAEVKNKLLQKQNTRILLNQVELYPLRLLYGVFKKSERKDNQGNKIVKVRELTEKSLYNVTYPLEMFQDGTIFVIFMINDYYDPKMCETKLGAMK